MVAYLYKVLPATTYRTGEGSRYLQNCAGSKGSCGYHASANGIRELKVAYFLFYVSKLVQRRELGLR